MFRSRPTLPFAGLSALWPTFEAPRRLRLWQLEQNAYITAHADSHASGFHPNIFSQVIKMYPVVHVTHQRVLLRQHSATPKSPDWLRERSASCFWSRLGVFEEPGHPLGPHPAVPFQQPPLVWTHSGSECLSDGSSRIGLRLPVIIVVFLSLCPPGDSW